MTNLALDDAGAPPFVAPLTLMDDPHAKLASLREAHPVIQIGDQHYLALRAGDVRAMLTDPRTVQIDGGRYAAVRNIPEGPVTRFLRGVLLFADGEDHRAKRGLFAAAFAHKPMREARARIRAVAAAIFADLPRGESFDFVDRMAARVPAEMIASILGLPTAEVPYFAGRVYQLARAVQPIYPHADHDDIEAAAAELFDYVEAHMRARMATPRDDLLSTVVASWRSDQAISFESLVLQVLAIVVGGSDTTRAAFAMLVALLLERPEDWAALQADPALIPGAVAEGLRYEPSVASISRFTKTQIEIGGVAVPAGVALSVSTLSAMRDPALYADPDRFDIRRTDHPRLHLVFGLGPHRCIGEMLARIELEEGLVALIEAGLEIEMETRPSMRGFGGIRQITPMQARIR